MKITDYKSAMKKIKATNSFKEGLKSSISKTNADKRTNTNKIKRWIPAIATAAVIFMVFLSTSAITTLWNTNNTDEFKIEAFSIALTLWSIFTKILAKNVHGRCNKTIV